MGHAGDTRRAIDGAAEKVVVAALDNASMQAATYPKGDALRRFGVGERLLQLQRGAYRIEGIVEGGVGSVAGHFHDNAAVALYGDPGDCVVARQAPDACVPVPAPKGGTALDIGEQESDDAGRCLHGLRQESGDG